MAARVPVLLDAWGALNKTVHHNSLLKDLQSVSLQKLFHMGVLVIIVLSYPALWQAKWVVPCIGLSDWQGRQPLTCPGSPTPAPPSAAETQRRRGPVFASAENATDEKQRDFWGGMGTHTQKEHTHTHTHTHKQTNKQKPTHADAQSHVCIHSFNACTHMNKVTWGT